MADRPKGLDDTWRHAHAIVAALDSRNGVSQREVAMRLLKVAEEAGEVASAYIGMVGQNPRKGTTHAAIDVAKELCDVILTAMVALPNFTDAPELLLGEVAAHRAGRLAPGAGCAWPACLPDAEQQAAAHRCGNCEGVDPGTCVFNPDPTPPTADDTQEQP